MVDLTTQVPGGGGGGNAGSSFSDLYWNVYNETDPSKLIGLDASNAVAGGQVTLKPPVGVSTQSYTLALAELGNAFTDSQSITDTGSACLVLHSTQVSVGGPFIDIIDTVSSFTMSLIAEAGFAASRIVVVPDANGAIALRGYGGDPPPAAQMGKVNRTGQTADIASVKLTNAVAAGQYLIVGELECSTGAGGAGTVTVTFSWTNDSGAKTSAVTLSLGTAGSTPILIPAYLTSSDITWAVTHTGLYLTAQYALRTRIVNLG